MGWLLGWTANWRPESTTLPFGGQDDQQLLEPGVPTGSQEPNAQGLLGLLIVAKIQGGNRQLRPGLPKGRP